MTSEPLPFLRPQAGIAKPEFVEAGPRTGLFLNTTLISSRQRSSIPNTSHSISGAR
jgi:hypothetical protein